MNRRASIAGGVFLLIFGMCLLPLSVFAQGRTGGVVTPSGRTQSGDVAGVFDIFRTYTCGSGYTFLRFDISSTGNVVGMRHGIGAGDHINEGIVRTGYETCYVHPTFGFTSGHDLAGDGTVGYGAASVFSGCSGSTFPCEITRLGPFGETRILRRITGNSFVGPAPVNGTFDNIAGGGNGDGIGCNTLGECSNCTNRTLHVVTRITNLTGVTLGNVEYQEIIDFDMFDENGVRPNEIYTRTSGSMTAVSGNGGFDEDIRKGALLQSLVINPITDANTFGSTPLNCDGSFGLATPTGVIDGEARVLQFHGPLGAGSNTGNNFRVHIRGL